MVVEQLNNSFEGTNRGEIYYQVKNWVIAKSTNVKNMAQLYQLHRLENSSDVQDILLDISNNLELVALMEKDNNTA